MAADRTLRVRTTAYALVVAVAALLATSSARADSSAGGAYASPAPRLVGVVCRTDCAGVRTVRAGALLRVRGRELRSVTSIVFQGALGAGDDKAAAPVRARTTWLDVRVPRGAATGPIVAVNADGARSRVTRRASVVVEAGEAAPRGSAQVGAGGLLDVAVSAGKVFYGAERKASLSYMVRDSQAATVSVELVRTSDTAPVARWDVGAVPPNTPQLVEWDGHAADGSLQPDGRYEFRVYAQTAAGLRASSAAADGSAPDASFVFVSHKFPVRAAHDYGGAAAHFGGGRGHQGQDVFATCGTPLVAARAGVVKIKQQHSRAGNYVVIDGDETDMDYVYMHMRDPALVNKNEHVFTGQLIGYVGDTGRAHGCHLHFELWSAPGWYTGGSPLDPLPQLKAWDRLS